MNGFVYEAKPSELDPVVNKKQQKAEKIILKCVTISQYYITMVRVSWRRRAEAAPSNRKMLQRLAMTMLAWITVWQQA